MADGNDSLTGFVCGKLWRCFVWWLVVQIPRAELDLHLTNKNWEMHGRVDNNMVVPEESFCNNNNNNSLDPQKCGALWRHPELYQTNATKFERIFGFQNAKIPQSFYSAGSTK